MAPCPTLDWNRRAHYACFQASSPVLYATVGPDHKCNAGLISRHMCRPKGILFWALGKAQSLATQGAAGLVVFSDQA
eukprot:566156-Pelagomonas_calceolata.AAC.2